jgi:3-hydroxyisobutyrate dehydrogenase-like beta-hydroxyacid dehydrogenase
MAGAAPQRVGIVGAGRMGAALGARLVQAGFTVCATDVDQARRQNVLNAGAGWREDTPQVAADADVVISSLPGPAEVTAVGAELAGALAPDAIWIDMSTVSPRVVRDDWGRGLDAPVGGGPDAARVGRLLAFVGGDEDDLRAVTPVLETVADRIVHVGPRRAGYAVKLLANALWFGQAAASAEALALAARAGLDPERVRAALAGSAAGGRFLEQDARSLLAGDDLPAFSLGRCCEQLAAVLELGDELAVPLDVAAAVAAVHRQALERYGDVDGELLGARFVAERAGSGFAPAPE